MASAWSETGLTGPVITGGREKRTERERKRERLD